MHATESPSKIGPLLSSDWRARRASLLTLFKDNKELQIPGAQHIQDLTALSTLAQAMLPPLHNLKNGIKQGL